VSDSDVSDRSRAPGIDGDAPPVGEQALAELETAATLGPLTHLPHWPRFTAARLDAALGELLTRTGADFDAIEAALPDQSGWDAVMVPVERLQLRLGRLFGQLGHLLGVKYDDSLQAVYDRWRADYVRLSNRMAQSQPLYDALCRLRDSAEFPSLEAARQRVLTESIRGMERSGVHLTGADRQRYQDISDELADLGNRFQTNLVKEEAATRLRIHDPAELAGVPPAVVEQAARTAAQDLEREDVDPEHGPWHFVINGPNYLAVIQHGAHRGLREAMYRAFRARGTHSDYDNRPVLRRMLVLRQELARLVGFDSYAELSVDAKMAPDVTAVQALMDRLEAAARPAAQREAGALARVAADGAGSGEERLEPWDVAFWSERWREQEYDYDAESLREYFQQPRVMQALFDLMKDLYGIDIEPADHGAVPVWDDSVSFYTVSRDGEVIAGFFVDPYARPGEKRAGAWMNTVVGRSRLLASGGRDASLPVALFVMNSRPPAAGRPALMSLDEVRTLFHEFGHATQHMFTDVIEGGAAGMNLVEWDAVELASQFNEFWMEQKDFLRNMTAHVDSGEPLDDATLERIIASRNFMVGNATLRQLHFARTDLALHERYGLPGSNDDVEPAQIEAALADSTLVLPRLVDESQLPSFGHLFAGGYAAGYYSYKWAEVLAADAFAAFEEAGLDDVAARREIAARFRETVLGLGGSLPAAEVYRRFRGRDPSADALLRQQGLSTSSG